MHCAGPGTLLTALSSLPIRANTLPCAVLDSWFVSTDTCRLTSREGPFNLRSNDRCRHLRKPGRISDFTAISSGFVRRRRICGLCCDRAMHNGSDARRTRMARVGVRRLWLLAGRPGVSGGCSSGCGGAGMGLICLTLRPNIAGRLPAIEDRKRWWAVRRGSRHHHKQGRLRGRLRCRWGARGMSAPDLVLRRQIPLPRKLRGSDRQRRGQ